MIRNEFVRSPYNYDPDEVSAETGLACLDESMTSQEYAEEVDINTIASRFGLFGELPTDLRAPTFGDFEGVSDYHTAMNAVVQAKEAFEQMPAGVRARFHNDPGEFVEFCSDEKNSEEASKLGLMMPKAAELVSTEASASPAPAASEGTSSST